MFTNVKTYGFVKYMFVLSAVVIGCSIERL